MDEAMDIDDASGAIEHELQSYRYHTHMDTEMITHLGNVVEREWVDAWNSGQLDPSATLPSVCLVLDTNVVLRRLKFLTDLLDTLMMLQHSGVLVVIPWSVVQELDGLKRSDRELNGKVTVGYLARESIRILHQIVTTERYRPCVMFQRRNEQISVSPVPLSNSRRFVAPFVYLVTLDRNLALKSEIHGILAITQLDVSARDFIKNIRTHTDDSMMVDGTDEMAHAVRPQGHRPETAGSSATSAAPNSGGVPSTTLSSEKEVEMLRSSKILAADGGTDQQMAAVKVLEGVFQLLLTHLPATIRHYFKQTYGAEYELMYARDPPWQMSDLWFLVHKHWVAVFGEHLRGRSETIKRCEQITRDWVRSGRLTFGPPAWGRLSTPELCRDSEVVFSCMPGDTQYQPVSINQVLAILQGAELVALMFPLAPGDKADMNAQFAKWKQQLS